MFETIRPNESRTLTQKPANIPETSPVPPVCVNVQSKEAVYSELASRFVAVTNNCERYYQTDIVPPSTHSQFLRGMKFFVYGFWFWNAMIFVVSLLIPFRLDFPYGRLDINDFDLSLEHAAIMTVVLLLVAVRCIALTWSAEFYNYVQIMFLLELSLSIFTALWWSPGLPLLMVLIVSGLLNAYITQWYFTGAFLQTVKVMQSLVPPGFKRLIDHTILDEGAPTCEDFLRIGGYKDHRPAEFYNERCGVFGGKTELKHVLALQNCYAQALFPNVRFAEWKRTVSEIVDLQIWKYLDGLLYAFVMFVSTAFTGLWLGQVLSRNYSAWTSMLFVVAPIVVLRVLQFILTNQQLLRALGVAVAEKEWLAHDIVRHSGEREQMDLGPIDVTVGNGGSSPYYVGGFAVDGGIVDRGMGGGRLNMSFMWLALWVASDQVGASYVSAIANNLASETRFMIEHFTSYEFKQIAAAKWELSITLVINSMAQMLLFMLMTVLYFGTYFSTEEIPSGLVGVIGIACFLSAALKTIRTVNFAADVLSDNSPSPRQFCVSETIMFTVTLFLCLCVIMIWVLFPIMFNYDPPAPHCEVLNRFFPSLCAPFI